MNTPEQEITKTSLPYSKSLQRSQRRLAILMGTLLFITIIVSATSTFYLVTFTEQDVWLPYGGGILMLGVLAIWGITRMLNRYFIRPLETLQIEFGQTQADASQAVELPPATGRQPSDDEAPSASVEIEETNRADESQLTPVVLEEIRGRLREIYQADFEAIAICRKTRILDANQALANMFGYSRSEMVGLTLMELAVPESRSVVLRNSLIKYEKPYEVVGLKKGGATMPIEVASKAIAHQARTVNIFAVREIRGRPQADILRELQKDKEELETKVKEGSTELRYANERLQIELSERKQAETAIMQRNRELTTLQAAGVAITSSLDLRYVLDTVSREMSNLLEVENCTIFEWNQTEDTITMIAKFGPTGWWNPASPANVRYLADYPLTKGVLDEQIPEQMSINQPNVDPAEYAYMQKANIQTRMLLPMIFQGNVVGLVELEDSRVERTFTYHEISLVRLLANQAASAIANARLFNEVHRHLEELTTLNMIGQAITSTLNMEEMLAIINNNITRLLGVDATSVTLYDKTRDDLWFAAASGEGSDYVRGKRLQKGQGIVGWVIEHGAPVLIPDVSKDDHFFDQIDQESGFTTRSILCVPLQSKGQIMGAVEAMNKTKGSFDQEDLRLLSSVADLAAAAIENAQLYSDLAHERALLAERVEERTTELSRANAALAKAARLKDEFLAGMSHELRTPLNAILGASEILQNEAFGSINAKQHKYSHIIEESGHHLLALINDILDLSKIEAGKVELEIRPVSLVSVCEASLRMVKQQAHKKRLEISQSLDDNITSFQADERRLKQTLVNLLSNAVKFTPEGGEVGLEVVGDQAQQVVHFTVWDTGIGISQEDMSHLFQPFVQLDSSLSRQYAGTGLGLSLVSRLTELHGGGVSVESEVGRGSRFTVTLPWSGPVAVTNPDEKTEPTDVSRPGVRPGQKDEQPLILMADDNEDNINLLSDFLRLRGYQVIIARDGSEAIERARQRKPDLILMDVQMPGMDGLEATRRLRADANLDRLPIIAVTAMAMPGDRERCLRAGANEYLSKPVNLEGLVKIIEAHLT